MMTLHAASNRKPQQKQISSLPVGNPKLSVEQHRSIQYLLAGRTVNETAAMIGRSRDTVSRWRNENPHFIAEFNRQHGEICDGVKLRLQGLAVKATEVLEDHLNKGSLKAATEVLKIIDMYGKIPAPASQTDTELIVKEYAERMATAEMKKTPFSGANKTDVFTKELANDIAAMLKAKYDVTSSIQEFTEKQD
ncbi:MAG: helix-turn-helix domain-containing protein [Negativicutes bacterium]|nr:helix-turn-helix domain-containing protein [Negativicutes bacterium]